LILSIVGLLPLLVDVARADTHDPASLTGIAFLRNSRLIGNAMIPHADLSA